MGLYKTDTDETGLRTLQVEGAVIEVNDKLRNIVIDIEPERWGQGTHLTVPLPDAELRRLLIAEALPSATDVIVRVTQIGEHVEVDILTPVDERIIGPISPETEATLEWQESRRCAATLLNTAIVHGPGWWADVRNEGIQAHSVISLLAALIWRCSREHATQIGSLTLDDINDELNDGTRTEAALRNLLALPEDKRTDWDADLLRLSADPSRNQEWLSLVSAAREVISAHGSIAMAAGAHRLTLSDQTLLAG